MTISKTQDVTNQLTKCEIRTLKFIDSMVLAPIIVWFYLSLRFDVLMNSSEFDLMCLDWPQALVISIGYSLLLLPFIMALVSKLSNIYISRKHKINDIRLNMEMSRPVAEFRRSLLGFSIIIVLEIAHQLFCVIGG